MKKIILWVLLGMVFSSCGDDDSEDFDPTRVDIVTGMIATDAFGQPVATLGNPNIFLGNSITVFEKPASGVMRVVARNPIRNIWLVTGFPTDNFITTDFNQVFSENPFSVATIENNAFRALEELGSTTVSINLDGITQGYYRIFIQLENDDLFWDNFYVERATQVTLDDINFWD